VAYVCEINVPSFFYIILFSIRGKGDKESKRSDGPPVYQSSDSETMVPDSVDSSFEQTVPKESSFSTPVRGTRSKTDRGREASVSPSPSPSPTGRRDDRDVVSLEKERAKLDRQQRKLDEETKRVERLRREIEAKEADLEADQQALAEEREVFQLEQERMRQTMDDDRKAYEAGLKGAAGRSGDAASAEDTAEVKDLRAKCAKLKEDCDDMRRQNISLKMDIEKGQKSLDAEKNVRLSSSLHHDLIIDNAVHGLGENSCVPLPRES
jgi:anti-sigma28 factor (negative regulator of flagellin synthesis)